VFLASVGIVILLITAQAKFSLGSFTDGGPERNYRTPPASGFAELAASMRRDRQTAPEARPSEVRTQRVVIQGRLEEGRPAPRPMPVRPSLPRYYSEDGDAQLAKTLKTMKVQAITAKPVIEDFKIDESERETGAPLQGGSGPAN
jgi:hypothetical protein